MNRINKLDGQHGLENVMSSNVRSNDVRSNNVRSNNELIFSPKAILRTLAGLALVFALCFTGAKSAGAQEVVAIAAGGPAQSNSSGGDDSFVADEDFSGGGDNAVTSATINLTQPGVNAAPMGVYQHARAGVFTYTIPGLTVGAQYTVL